MAIQGTACGLRHMTGYPVSFSPGNCTERTATNMFPSPQPLSLKESCRRDTPHIFFSISEQHTTYAAAVGQNYANIVKIVNIVLEVYILVEVGTWVSSGVHP